MDLVSGEVYLWDHQRHDLVFQAANLDYVASSLPDLLSGLAGEEVPGPDEIEVLGKSGDRDSARVFLRAHSVDEKNSDGRTLAMEAARYENLPVLKECVEHGASLSLLLHYAANNKSTRLLEYLLEVGADINERDPRGRTPLARAKMSDKTRRFIASRGGT
jgi:ankyrin repeat protein